jgi:hypothetical protein
MDEEDDIHLICDGVVDMIRERNPDFTSPVNMVKGDGFAEVIYKSKFNGGDGFITLTFNDSSKFMIHNSNVRRFFEYSSPDSIDDAIGFLESLGPVTRAELYLQ